ncbi:MAG TPA: hypothetical protein ENK02_05445 [Planctomycetes bacterium]|nr:hypothetical protein [Planctomycetota bacterium]
MKAFLPLGLLPLLALSSCFLFEKEEMGSEAPVSAFLGDRQDLRLCRRVLVLPIQSTNMTSTLRKDLEEALLSELAFQGRFQVLRMEPSQGAEGKEIYPTERRGRIDPDLVVELGRRYQADALLLTRVTQWFPYKPPRIGLRLQLVSVHSGKVIWAIDQTWDAGTERTRLDLINYARTTLAPQENLHGWEFLMISPRRFGRFALRRSVNTLSRR